MDALSLTGVSLTGVSLTRVRAEVTNARFVQISDVDQQSFGYDLKSKQRGENHQGSFAFVEVGDDETNQRERRTWEDDGAVVVAVGRPVRAWSIS